MREARDTFLAYWDDDGRRHFREEEEILLPACAEFMDVEQPLVARVLTDHVWIRHLADQARGEDPTLAVLHDLGRRLEQHIRREERELFPQIEQSVPDVGLRRLLALLSH
jgi:iron-sulfur cluster repair protein YtfE (RIC family)